MDFITAILFIISVTADILVPIVIMLDPDEEFRKTIWEVALPYYVMMTMTTLFYPILIF